MTFWDFIQLWLALPVAILIAVAVPGLAILGLMLMYKALKWMSEED